MKALARSGVQCYCLKPVPTSSLVWITRWILQSICEKGCESSMLFYCYCTTLGFSSTHFCLAFTSSEQALLTMPCLTLKYWIQPLPAENHEEGMQSASLLPWEFAADWQIQCASAKEPLVDGLFYVLVGSLPSAFSFIAYRIILVVTQFAYKAYNHWNCQLHKPVFVH